MCRAMEDMRNQALREGLREGRREGAAAVAKKLLSDGTLSIEKISECAGLSLEEVRKLQAGQHI